jgi:hypothetical protein
MDEQDGQDNTKPAILDPATIYGTKRHVVATGGRIRANARITRRLSRAAQDIRGIGVRWHSRENVPLELIDSS